jgi:hypothetical protein
VPNLAPLVAFENQAANAQSSQVFGGGFEVDAQSIGYLGQREFGLPIQKPEHFDAAVIGKSFDDAFQAAFILHGCTSNRSHSHILKNVRISVKFRASASEEGWANNILTFLRIWERFRDVESSPVAVNPARRPRMLCSLENLTGGVGTISYSQERENVVGLPLTGRSSS